MMTSKLLKRRTLWFGFAAVLAPLVILIVLQYRWLAELDHTSAIAHEAILDNYLEAVAADVEYSYRKAGERALNLSPTIFTQDRLIKAAYHFKKKQVQGVKRLFVVSFVNDHDGHILYFNPDCTTFSRPEWSPEVRAVYVATSPWKVMAHKGGVVEPVSLTVDERDPDHRIVLMPITDDASRLVGVAGMILDPEYFRHTVLPRAIEKSVPQGPIVSVWDSRGDLVFSTDPKSNADQEARKPFPFVFKDWHISLTKLQATPGQWARRNFVLNIGLSTLLALALLSGVVLALRMASREMKLSQMKSDFVSNVSHELRTPLASIRVFGEFLRLGRVDSPEKIREYGDYIETESRRLTQLINNLLDFASIESGRKTYRFERMPLEDVVTETLRTFEVRLRQSGFRITYDRPDAPLPPLWIDPAAVAQSLSNLLDNAVKYANGSTEIVVRLRREGGMAVVAVQDFGIGIPRDEQQKIFDRFHRVGTGLVHDIKGSGLGLAIVRHILEAHGGHITVESRPGDGSTFYLYLPIDALSEEAAAEARAPLPGAPAARRRPSEA
ncbi:MAG TPA: sensor histidine kinase [Thermoanaerobaculia bacterium]|nr:sensor histidine kinase [Thermoanaerobaculia bacterium]